MNPEVLAFCQLLLVIAGSLIGAITLAHYFLLCYQFRHMPRIAAVVGTLLSFFIATALIAVAAWELARV